MNNTNMAFVFEKKIPIMIYVADMAVLMSNFDNDQISSKFTQRYQMKPKRYQMKPF